MPAYKCDKCNRVWVYLWTIFDEDSKIVECDTCDNKFRVWKDKSEYELIDPVTEISRTFNTLTPPQQREFISKLRKINALH